MRYVIAYQENIHFFLLTIMTFILDFPLIVKGESKVLKGLLGIV